MTHYLPVIKRAVEALDPNTVEARAELYDRARRMLQNRFSAHSIELELASLNETIELVEAEELRRSGAVAAGRAAPPPADDLAEQSVEERARWRAVLSESPGHTKTFAAFGAVLLVLAIGAAAFWLWPKSKRAPVVAAGQERPAINYVYLRQPVYYRTTHPEGTIIVDKAQKFLYVVRPNVVAIRYGIGVGRECANAAGLHRVTGKEEWPGLRGEDRDKNPLGPRAIFFEPSYRIHGTSAPAKVIGDSVVVGCVHLSNDDVLDLYDKTEIDTRVVVTE